MEFLKVLLVLFLCVIALIIIGQLEKIRVYKLTKSRTLSPTTLTHIDGLSGYGSGTKVKLSKTSSEIKVDGNHFIRMGDLKSTTLTSSRQLVNQHKSVLGRSIAGAVVAGPIGAIVGGISGTGTKQTTATVSILTINYYKGFGEKKTVIFSVEDDPHIVGNLEMAFNVCETKY